MLSVLAKIYGVIADIRNAMYDRGLLRSYPLDAKTISIGNITTGGTGKTPLTALAAEILAENGEKVCILTRGYGRRNPSRRVIVSEGEGVLVEADIGGDEPVELAHRLAGKAAVIADADRVASARWAREHLGITAFVLDDGFQHRRAVRDLDIVCVDAANPFGNGRMLPAGRLREMPHNLARAGAIVVTLSGEEEISDDLTAKIRELNPECPIFAARRVISGFVEILPGGLYDTADGGIGCDDGATDALTGRVLAFCGLANPQNFFSEIEGCVYLAAVEKFRDHHNYTQSDADALTKIARGCGAEMLVTTVKDAVKLGELSFGLPCFAAKMEMAVEDEAAFREFITASF